jgi:hypothetical protein
MNNNVLQNWTVHFTYPHKYHTLDHLGVFNLVVLITGGARCGAVG